jgi:hypothetical protein
MGGRRGGGRLKGKATATSACSLSLRLTALRLPATPVPCINISINYNYRISSNISELQSTKFGDAAYHISISISMFNETLIGV